MLVFLTLRSIRKGTVNMNLIVNIILIASVAFIFLT